MVGVGGQPHLSSNPFFTTNVLLESVVGGVQNNTQFLVRRNTSQTDQSGKEFVLTEKPVKN